MSYCYDYPRPALAADTVLFRLNAAVGEVLLIRRKFPPFQWMWALPGGFMEIGETLEEAAVRELEEETGIRGVELKQFRAYSNIDRDPRTRVITVVFFGMIDFGRSQAQGGDDAAEAGWFPVNSLPETGFDHALIIAQILSETSILPG
jgi:8-oxo-dGTP diphosphatase